MTIPDPAKAEEYLQRIGYYRLSAYWYPFRAVAQQPDGSFALGDTFKAGTEFKHATDLYAFDKGLRLLAIDAIERIEISIRTEVALALGRNDPYAHRQVSFLDRNFTTPAPGYTDAKHTGWLQKLDERAATSKEEFAVHFRTKYPTSSMPIWMGVELLDFGPLSHFLAGMRYADLQIISRNYGGLRPHLIKSWARALCGVRNVCAHHARLWNKPLIDQPALPRQKELPELDHLVSGGVPNKRVYAALAVLQVLLKQANPRTKWADRLKAHMATFPNAPNIKIADAGFPPDWEKLPLWQ